MEQIIRCLRLALGALILVPADRIERPHSVHRVDNRGGDAIHAQTDADAKVRRKPAANVADVNALLLELRVGVRPVDAIRKGASCWQNQSHNSPQTNRRYRFDDGRNQICLGNVDAHKVATSPGTRIDAWR